MADVGSFSFLPWLRRGMASRIARGEGDPAAPGSDVGHVGVPVSVTLNGDLTTTIPLTLLGPGEVTGVDRDAIIRIAPTPDAFDVENNYLPLLEFDQADLPWRYTPARSGDDQRLTPWLCLVVLRDDEIQELREPGAAGSLPLVTVTDAALLPPWGQLWAWAHVQISGAKNLSADQLRTVIETEPQRAISRLLSPRRLEPFTSYTAFLVPSFERGRRAGAGEPVPPDLDALTPAWGDSGPVRLPVYFRWRFGTAAAGDFEFLVRQLEARVLPPTVGRRDLDVSTPGEGLPAAFDRPLGLEGALGAIGMERTDWSGSVETTFVAALSALVNLPADRLQQPDADRAVVPPLYGRWHAQSEREIPGAQPTWFNDLNQDPRERVAAGAGTRVIQQQQRQLMASAWQQVQGIRETNDRLRLTQLARELAGRIYRRHLPTGDPDQLLQVGAPVLSRILASPTTIRARLLASPILPGTLEAQFRRLARPRGPVGRRQGRSLDPKPTALFSRLNRGELRGAGPPTTSPGLVTPVAAPPVQVAPVEVARLRARARVLPFVAIILLAIGLVLGFVVGVAVGLLTAAGGVGVAFVARQARAQLAAADRSAALAAGMLTAAQIEQAPPRPGFRPTEAVPGALAAEPAVIARSGPGDTPSAAAFRAAAAQLMTGLGDPVAIPPALEAVPLGELRAKVETALDPRTTVVAGLPGRLRLPGIVKQPATEDPAEPVMAAPIFPQPMYAPLAAVSQDWMLPGLDQVAPNTMTTALTNQRFIEAYMVGLNHEMARELQWNEYPTDMRGTYFQQFWDPAGSDGAPASLLDITPLTSWEPSSALGTHPVRTPPPGGQHLVLLIRGEVFRRYPNTQVYAVRAKSAPGGVHALGDEERLPVFSGRLPPDVAFFGFELTADEARGDENAESSNQGWFFILQEHPSEPRFGLDVPDSFGGQPASWSDLSWGHLAADASALAQVRYIDLTATLPDTSQVAPTGGAHWHVAEGARASDLAYITLQQPMRVAVHGSDMIPPPAQP